MKTETIAIRNWDDLVFVNRNRDYGAYSIRKSYEKSMITGLGVSVSLACLLILAPQIISRFGNKTEKPITTIEEIGQLVALPPPTIDVPRIAPPPPPPPQAQIQQTTANLTPEVVTHDVETVLPTNEEINASQPANTNPGNGPSTSEVVPSLPEVDNTDYDKEFKIVEIPPAYEGGMQEMYRFISRNVKYPSAARRMGISGTVYVTFVVNKDGEVVNVSVARGISAECDKEAARVIAMLKGWKPGVQNKHNVSVRMTLPIKFHLAE